MSGLLHGTRVVVQLRICGMHAHAVYVWSCLLSLSRVPFATHVCGQQQPAECDALR